MSDFYNTTFPKAQRCYTCEWCGETIQVLEKHVHFVGTWEGEWQNWRMHDECHEAAADSDEMQDGFSPYEHERPLKVSK